VHASQGLVQTVLGTVPPESLGLTSSHEHLLIDFALMFTPPSEASEKFKAYQPVTMENLGWVRYLPFRNFDNLQLLDEEVAISEALLFKRAGGETIVDATTIGIGRDPLALARIARATGLNVVMGAGYYVDASLPPGMDDKSEEEITREIVSEITTGVGDTGVKAGIIGEIGCTWPLTQNERKVLRAAANAQGDTSATILVHPGRHKTAPFEILEILAEAGADVRRVVMAHMERTIVDLSSLIELAESGCCLEYDLFGWESSYYPLGEPDMAHDGQRLDYIKRLVEAGHAERIVVGQDIFAKSRLVKYGGYGYAHLVENIMPRMREKGIPEDAIEAIMVGNPARNLDLTRGER